MNGIIKPIVYIGIILLAVLLKRVGLFKDKDSETMSKILMNITLPLTVINACSGIKPDTGLFWLIPVGLLTDMVFLLVAFIIMRKQPKDICAFSMINISGYNLGAFAIPLIQLFFGSAGVVVASMVDMGNAIMVFGGTFALTSAILHIDDGQRTLKQSITDIAKKLFSSVTFDTYLVIMVIMILRIQLPEIVGQITQPFANANVFVAMFMLGLMFKIPKEKQLLMVVLKTLLIRVCLSVAAAAFVFYVLPFDLIIRQVATVCLIAPIASVAPVYTSRIGPHGSTASFYNILSVFVSFIMILILVFGIYRVG